MVAIAPFRALRYRPSELGRATSPPHDCAPSTGWEPFLAEPHNIAHIVLAKREGGDAVEDAARKLEAWTRDGVLVRDDAPALYLYEISSGLGRMRGLLCRLGLDPGYQDVRRHEEILAGRKQERYRLRETLRTDPEPIWLLYRDERGWVDEVLWSNAHELLSEVTDEEGHTHRLWRVDRPEAIGEVVAQFEDRGLVIADGHHRYQTALDHWRATGRPEDGALLACLVRDTDPGIGLVATHRLVHLGGSTLEEATARLGRAAGPTVAMASRTTSPFSGASIDADRCLAALTPDTVVLVGRGAEGPTAVAVHLPPPAAGDRRAALTVARVHDHVLSAWGVQPEQHLGFTRDAQHAVDAVASGDADLAVLLPPEDITSVLEVAAAGQLMPQKSTYFVPKLRSGLVLSPLDEAPPSPPTRSTPDEATPGRFRLPPT